MYMGNKIKFLIATLLTIGLVYFLNNNWNIKGTPIPAFGKFFNPFSGFWQNAEPLVDKIPLDLTFEELSDSVSISYDEYMIPHVFAKNTKDLVFVQGYLHAKDRLWQMDFATRATSGRLSEVVGDKAIEYDKYQRRKGYTFAAENAVNGWKKFPESYSNIESYVAGVNKYMSSLQPKNYPIEFKLLSYEPEAWTPLKTALFYKSMAQSLNSFDDDIELTNVSKLLGADLFNKLFPESYKEEDPIIPSEVKFDFKPSGKGISPNVSTNKNDGLTYYDFKQLEKPDPNNGSNNWAVAGSKTLNKKPILCGDPHLKLRFPSTWYQIQLQTPEFNAQGVSLPGIPFIIIGYNEHIAWTETNVGQDVSDWYTISWKDSGKKQYKLDDKYIDAKWRIENILVKGKKEAIVDTVKYTIWGPVVFETDTIKKDMAWRWISHDTPMKDEMKTFHDLCKSKNYNEYIAATDNFTTPAQNFAFACTDGDIALRVNGELPIKSIGQGRFVQDGSSSSNAWNGMIPAAQRAVVRNPSRGFISSANQKSTSSAYPYYYNSGVFEPYRGRTLNNALRKMESITVDDMKKLQNSSYSLRAEEGMGVFKKLIDSNSLNTTELTLWNRLKDWNFEYKMEDMNPVVFENFFKNIKESSFDELFKSDNPDRYAIPFDAQLIFLMRDEPNSKLFDLLSTKDKLETAKDIVNQAFKKTCTEIPKMVAENKGPLNWQKVNNANVEHIARIPAFSKNDIAISGTRKSLNAIDGGHGPSWRMVVEMDSIPHAWVIYPGGQSGNPGSKYYDNFLDKWAKGEYNEAIFLKGNTKDKRIKFTQYFTKKLKL
jgi:penicillin G amidase